MKYPTPVRNVESLDESQREDLRTLKAMSDAAMTPQTLDGIAEMGRELGLFYLMGKKVGWNKSRLLGKVNWHPSVYVNKETGHTQMISGGRVVGSPYVSAYDLAETGYRFMEILSD